MTVKINSLEIENVKRVKAVKLEPKANGLTIIGGNNEQGKTSVLDSIAWALGGNGKKPSNPERNDSVNKPYLKVTMNNGLVVERKGKNSDLKVTDPMDERHGQTLLNSFVEELAIDLPKFIDATNKEKADILLQIIGVSEELYQLEKEEQEKYDERTTIGRIVLQKKKYAEELMFYDNVPEEPVKVKDLIDQQQEILARNGANNQKRQQAEQLEEQVSREAYQISQKQSEIKRLQEELTQLEQTHATTQNDLVTAKKTAQELQDESTAEIEQSIQEIENLNEKVRTNQQKEMAEEEARQQDVEYEKLTVAINELRQAKTELLQKADLPLPELSVQDGELTYKGQKWDGMSGSQQLKVSTAIVRKLKPNCGFVLIDKLEQMDLDTLNEFGQWLEQENLQAIAARVTTGEEASIIIENGEVVGDGFIELSKPKEIETEENSGWKGGF